VISRVRKLSVCILLSSVVLAGTAVGQPSNETPESSAGAALPEQSKPVAGAATPAPAVALPPAPAEQPAAAPPAPQGPAEPFAYGDFTWLNGNSRQHKAVLDTKYFTPEVLIDVNYTASQNMPIDNTVVGSTALSRNNEFTLAFLGFAAAAGHPLSCKSVLRTDPSEKVGVYAQDGSGGPRVAEYTELSAQTASALDADGLPVHREANIASHLIRMDLAESFAALELPWHLARKKIPHVDPATGADLSDEMACKYERFLFDAFPSASGMSLLRVSRDREFAPVKNAEGPDSPGTAREALEKLHRSWRESWGQSPDASWVDPSESFDGERPSSCAARPRPGSSIFWRNAAWRSTRPTGVAR